MFNKDDFACLFFFFWPNTTTGKSRKSCVIEIYYDFVFSWIKWDVFVVLRVLSVQSHREFLGLCSNSQVALLVSAVHFPSVALRINIAVSWEKKHMHFMTDSKHRENTVNSHSLSLLSAQNFARPDMKVAVALWRKVGVTFVKQAYLCTKTFFVW